ncbi:hypothetical protein [Candidatus Mycolicibacterium alkanivorans]|uniref:TetR family transcriptional regulator n=1 Tax=Candidatus Mycolicibacterium alkanivorans TaxID=2954114 RepID=A0ABS9YRA7_9MYCO|nr:hypothetical protein [Candidatus Mycolicibacterium alkanivorans]MCI4673776.1 hypothetical protein [Candidatus Mycolicibacterium alkanivorans]
MTNPGLGGAYRAAAHGHSTQRHLLEINEAINQLGRLISDDPGAAEVIWSAMRGMVLVEMIVNAHLEWERERQLLVDMVTGYLQSPSEHR